MGIKNVQGNNKDFTKPLTTDAIHRFERFLENHGLERKDPVEINPGKPQRAYTVINNKRALSGYYAFYDNYGTPVGFASDYRTGQTHNFKMSGVKAGKVDTEALARFKEEARLDQEQKWLKVSEKAKMIWDVALPCDSHPYLLSKGVASHSLREHKGKLIIPIMDETGKLWSLQMIDTNGGKRFLSGGKTGGCFFIACLLYTSPSPRDGLLSRMPSSA